MRRIAVVQPGIPARATPPVRNALPTRLLRKRSNRNRQYAELRSERCGCNQGYGKTEEYAADDGERGGDDDAFHGDGCKQVLTNGTPSYRGNFF